MVKRSRIIQGICLLICIASLAARAAAADFFFKDGDAIAVMGDSITEQHLYSNYLEMWTLSRFPAWKLEFHNVGIGGDRSPGGNGRFARDVLTFKATAMTVDFGMNDGGYSKFNPQGFKTYMEGLEGIARQAKAAGIRVAWLTPSPIEKGENGPAIQGYNETLEKYSEGVKELAAANGAVFVDQFHPFVAVQDKARAEKPANRIGGGDAVHPGPPGQALMAWAILKGLGFPRLVSAAEVDAAACKVATSENCKIDDVLVKDGGLKFQRLDQALPFFPAEAKSILKWAPILEELNEYGLKVSNLKAGQYDILLDGKKVARHSDAELAAGANLAAAVLETGPIAEQVHAAWKALTAKNNFHHDRIFNSFLRNPQNIPDWLDLKPEEIESKRAAAMQKRMAEYLAMQEGVRQALAPRPYSVEIVPVQ
ncbi:MAG: SGNH/GDSL hydrolase family protein [Thermoguttaceae bacterium]